MGITDSKTSLVEPFTEFGEWKFEKSVSLLQDYRDKDYDFGVDAEVINDLLGGNSIQTAKGIASAYGESGSEAAIINALSFICGCVLFSDVGDIGSALSLKAGLIFDAFDFSLSGEITIDELTVLLLSVAKAAITMTGKVSKYDPRDETMEEISIQAFEAAGVDQTGAITRQSFIDFVTSFIDDAAHSDKPGDKDKELPATDLIDIFCSDIGMNDNGTALTEESNN